MGKTGLTAGKEGGTRTVEIHGPLARAMAGGTVVVFDEFTALPQEQMVFLKGILNKKTGDWVDVPGNGRVRIERGFQLVFTANLKSEKNQERQELPPEIAREFEQNNLKVPYLPKDEAYTVVLTRLMDSDGSAALSDTDASTTLKALCDAMADIQEAYTAKTNPERAALFGEKAANGDVPSLKKFVLTQGTVEAILMAWKRKQQEGTKESFVAFLDQRLAIGLTFEEYSKGDRMLAAKILASRGLLRTLKSTDLGMPSSVFDFDVSKALHADEGVKELMEKSGENSTLLIKRPRAP